MVVTDGACAGRMAAWDGLVWSERGSPRAKRLLRALRFEVCGEIELEPHDLLGRSMDVELVPEEWENPVTGRRQRRNVVPYDGFVSAGTVEERAGLQPEGEAMLTREA